MSDNVYFKNKKKNDNRNIEFKTSLYVEHIPTEQLDKEPGDLTFGDIVTDDNERITHNKKQQTVKEKPKKKHHIFRNILIVVLSLLIVVFGCTAGFMFWLYSDYVPVEYAENTYIMPENMASSENIYNILFIGADSAFSEESPQAGSLTLLSYNKKAHEVKLTEFDGSVEVTIPSQGSYPLNYVINNLSAQFTTDTFEFNFGIDADAFVKYNYTDLGDLIDAVGSVPITGISEEEAEIMNNEGFEVTAGEDINANGAHALIYLRAGQQISTEKGAENLSSLFISAIKKSPVDFIKGFQYSLGTVESSLTKKQLFSFPEFLVRCIKNKTENMSVPAADTWFEEPSDNGTVKKIDFGSNIKGIRAFIYG